MPRTERLGLVLSSREKAALEHLADMEGGLSQAALVRRLIRQAAKDEGLWPEGQGQGDPGQVKMGEVARERVGL